MRATIHLTRKLGVRDDELRPLSAGFAAFCSTLAGYFLLLPLRDEAGVSLGTHNLPRLFVGSLFLTFLATPLASAFLSRSPAKERGLQLLFRCLSLSILGFLALYVALGSPAAAGIAASSGRHLAGAPGANQLAPAQAAVRVCFFLWVSLLNLVAVSSLWARSADVFSPEAAGRLFGLLGAGATLGQLLGSLAAGALARAPVLGGGGGAPSLLPLLASAGMLELAGQAAAQYRLQGKPAGSGGGPSLPMSTVRVGAEDEEEVDGGDAQSKAPGLGGAASGGKAGGGGPAGGASAVRALQRGGGASGSLLGHLLGRTLEGYCLIRASPYLLHMCAYLGLNYISSSFFYFEKSLVVAKVPDAASRTAWFAAINSVSAFFILGLQLLATGRALRFLGLPVALSVLPTSAGLLMAGIALWPAPASVAAAEVLRKIVSYSLARPARESLFTVVSRAEKYTAKIFMDTVVQRLGDTCAAAAFQALVPALGFGPSGVAAACVPVCLAWAVVAFRLGQRQQRLTAGSSTAT